MDLHLQGRVALVAGSSRGIGRAIATALAREGCRVAVTGRDPGAVQDAVDAIGVEAPGAAAPFPGDLSSARVVAATVDGVIDRWGTLDILVANIGTGTARPGWQLGDLEWERSLEANLHASRRLAEAVLPGMLERHRGSIIFITSIVALESLRAPLTYSAAKAALASYSKNLARLVARAGVRVNAVAPGNILFEGGSWATKLAQRGDEVRRYIDAEVPAGRFGTPEEIADLVVFLASDRAAFVTGSCFVADGGQTRSY